MPELTTAAHLRGVLSRMRCLVWTADVALRDGSLEWDLQVVNPEVLLSVLPQVAHPGDTWEQVITRARVPEDAQRADETARQAILAGEPSYAHDLRHVDWYGDTVWLHEDVVIEPTGEGLWRVTGTVSEVTVRRRAEGELRAVISGVQCLMWHAKVADHDGVLQWHIDPVDYPVAERFFPVDLEPGEAWHEAVNRARRPADVVRMEHTSRTAIRSGARRYSQEFACVDRDGVTHWLREEVFVEPDGADRWRLVGVTMDVTDRRRAEDGLRQSEQHAALIADSLPVLIAYIDSDERYQFCNRTYSDWVQWDVGNVRGTPVRDLIDAPLYDELRGRIQAVLSGERVRFDLELPGDDGETRHVDCLYVPDIADDGAVRGFISLITDVTDRQRALSNARDSEAHLRAIMDGAADGIITMDAQGAIASLNPSAADMFGYSREELLGQNVSAMMPDPRARTGSGYVKSYLGVGEATAVGTRREVDGRRKDGTTFRASVSIGEVLLDGGAFFAIVVRDITEQLALRDELIALNAQLERRVEERTVELAREAEQHRATARVARQQSDELAHMVRSARCVLWSTSGVPREGGYQWTLLAPAESGLAEFLPVEIRPGKTYDDGWYRSVPTEDIARIDEATDRAIREGQSNYTVEYRSEGPAGAIRWLQDDISVERLGEDEWLRTGVLTDITDQKRSELVQQVVYEISEATHTALDPTSMHRGIHQSLSKLLDAPGYVVMLSEPGDSGAFDFVYRVLGSERGSDGPRAMPRSRTARVARSGKTEYLTAADTARLVDEGEIELYDAFAGAWLGAPLIVNDTVIGVVALLHPCEEDPYTQGEIAVFEYVCQQIAVAIDRGRVLEDLQREKRLFQALMDNVPDTIYLKDAESRFVRVNDIGGRALGLADGNEALGLTDAHWHDEPLAGRLRDEELEVMRTGQPIVGRIDPVGSDYWISVTKAPLRDETGAVVGIVGVNRDVSEVMRAQQALKDGEDQRTQLMDRMLVVQEEERARISRELHDQVGQELTSVLLGLRVIESAKTMADATLQAAELRKVTSATLEDIRQIAFDMRPSSLDDLGLETALRRDMDTLAKNAGFTATLHVHNPDDISASIETDVGLYRLAHAALTNVVRHANAGAVTVTLRAARVDGDRVVSLLVEDDGVGFDTDDVLAGPVGGRFGLLSMQERARLMGGTATIASVPGEGCTVLIEIPIADESHSDG
jgi:PAS domain S-box-containing protein